MSGAGWHFIGEEEESLVLEVLHDRKLSRYRNSDEPKSKTEQFEEILAEQVNVSHCLATNSCTSALILGLLSLGIGPGDEVLVPGYTFIATIASIIHVGATPVLVEIDESLTMDPEDVTHRITARTRAIIVVHMLGAPANMSSLCALANQHGLHLIEDVAQASGGSFDGVPLGSFGSFGAFSFNVFKVLTTGDGGALTTNDPQLAARAFSFHDHGFERQEGGAVEGGEVLGFNLRMHELASAIGVAQLRKQELILDHVRKQKSLLTAAIGDIDYFSRRRLNDPDGECGTTVVYIADRPERASLLANALSSCTLADSIKHHYRNMPQLRSISADSFYPGQLPRTDDILSRCVGVGIGVKDIYLGFGFAIDLMDSPEQIELIAKRFAEAAKK